MCRDPSGTMIAFGDMMRKQIVMPAHLMNDNEHHGAQQAQPLQGLLVRCPGHRNLHWPGQPPLRSMSTPLHAMAHELLQIPAESYQSKSGAQWSMMAL